MFNAPFCPLQQSKSRIQSGTKGGSVPSRRTPAVGWTNSSLSPLPDGGKATHTYWPDGQLAAISSSPIQNSPINNPQSSISPSSSSPIPNPQSSSSSSSYSFLWDGLALLKRNDTIYIIESHPSGGVPIASHPVGKPEKITYHLNDLLGTTLATPGPAGVNFSHLTSFGQPLKASTSAAVSSSPSAPSAPANPVPTTNQLPPTRQ